MSKLVDAISNHFVRLLSIVIQLRAGECPFDGDRPIMANWKNKWFRGETQTLINKITTVERVKQEFRSRHQQLLVKRKELIIRLGNTCESVVSNPKSICEEIKSALRDEIAEGLISTWDIERYCPDKWKKHTKRKNNNLSFSIQEKPYQQIAAIQEGKSVIVNETSSSKDPISSGCSNQQQPHDESKQHRIQSNDNNKLQITEGKSISKTSSLGLTYDTLYTDEDISSHLEERSEADQIILECRVTDYLRQQVDGCNLHLKNFQLRLEMEC